jgi:hypothetical protein
MPSIRGHFPFPVPGVLARRADTPWLIELSEGAPKEGRFRALPGRPDRWTPATAAQGATCSGPAAGWQNRLPIAGYEATTMKQPPEWLQ